LVPETAPRRENLTSVAASGKIVSTGLSKS
jgi:hypothetical protein